MSDVIIRDLTTCEECVQVLDIQRRCWGFEEEGVGLYPPLLLSASENGGTVLGAFDGDRMVGYLFGYPALHDPKGQRILKIHSQTMGVLPEYRNKGIAEQLKWAQRKQAMDLGIELITWTFDPLEGANARLNLHKLGGIVRTYKRNVYGEHFGQLNEGQPTDRFSVEWWIAKARFRILRPCSGQVLDPSTLLRASFGSFDYTQDRFQIEDVKVTQVEGVGPEQRLIDFDLGRTDAILAVEIPGNIQAIRRADLALAREWRFGTREVFETYFAHGYAAVGFVSRKNDAGRRNYYLLARLPTSEKL